MRKTPSLLVHAAIGLSALVGARADLGEDRCTVYTCGGNSAEIYGIPVHGVRIDGNARQGPAVVPNTFRVPATAPPLCFAKVRSLGIKRGSFIGLDERGREVCKADEVNHGWFHVEISGTKVPVWIDGMLTVHTWEADELQRSSVRAYRLTIAVPTNSRSSKQLAERQSICTLPAQGWVGSNPLGTNTFAVVDPSMNPGYALLVQGERYKDDGATGDIGPAWFNIACAGNAIAKMRLLGYDPTAPQSDSASDRPSTPEERTATLKMLTAKYRGIQGYTSQGMPLLWLSHRGIRYALEPAIDDSRVGPIEAQWDSTGVTCLSHMRRWRRAEVATVTSAFDGQREQNAANQLRAAAGGGANAPLPTCPSIRAPDLAAALTGATPGPPYWTTYTVDHVSHRPATDVPGRRLPTPP